MQKYLIPIAIAAAVSMLVVYLNNRGDLKFLLPEPPPAGGAGE